MKSFLLFVGSLFLAGAMSAAPNMYAGAYASPRIPGRELTAMAAAQAGGGHSVTLNWNASSSAASCTAPCTFGYNIFRGTTTGSEAPNPLNPTLVTGTTYTDSTVTLGSTPVTYFYTVEAVETVGGVTVASAPSNEASATFPGTPAPPSAVTANPH
jgi:hypothetical protein